VGEHLIYQINVLETVLKTGPGSHGVTLSIEQRLRTFESQTMGGGNSDLFGQRLGGVMWDWEWRLWVGSNGAADLTNRVNMLFS
jgi:hypothetical protein